MPRNKVPKKKITISTSIIQISLQLITYSSIAVDRMNCVSLNITDAINKLYYYRITIACL